MAVANGWSNPTTTSLGQTYEYQKTANGVKYMISARSNAKRITSITITASVTDAAADDAYKTGKATESAIETFLGDSATGLAKLINDNIGTGTEPF